MPRPSSAAAALLVAVSLAGCDRGAAAATPTATAEAPIAVQVGPVTREPMACLYATSATLRAEQQATVTARTHGVVRRLLAEEGAEVIADQPLAELEDEEQAIERARAEVVLGTEQRDLERKEQLHAERSLSTNDLEAARRTLDEARHRLALADLALKRTVIRAPFAGRILRRLIDPGATVADGTSVYELADCDPLCADVAVPERHVARLAVGQAVRLLCDASGAQLAARIERIAPSVDTTTGTVRVTLSVSGAGAVRPGAFVRVGIVTDLHPDALVLPRAALVPEGRRWHVYRLTPAGDAVEQLEVALGFEEGERVEVLPGPAAAPTLAAGDRVVVLGAAALAQGSKVVIPPAPAAAGTAATGSTTRG